MENTHEAVKEKAYSLFYYAQGNPDDFVIEEMRSIDDCQPSPKTAFDRAVNTAIEFLKINTHRGALIYSHSDLTGRPAGLLYGISPSRKIFKITAAEKKAFRAVTRIAKN